MHIAIENIAHYEGKEVTIKGWLYNKRSSGKVHFLLIRDGTGIIQSVVSRDEIDDKIFEIADTITQESSLIITGLVRKDTRAAGGHELVIKTLQVIQMTQDYPITPKEHSIEFLLPLRHLWLRSKKQVAILRIRHEIIKACRQHSFR